MKENIEEDIKNIEEIIELSKEEIDAKDENITAILDIEDLISLEHILRDYKRVLKENELLRKDIESWKKYCEEIEEEQTEMSNKNCELEFEVEKLQKENEELKNKLLDTLEGQKVIKEETPKYIKENYIPIQKIKDKIEEIQEEGYWLFITDRDSDKCVEVLQELLEGRNNNEII